VGPRDSVSLPAEGPFDKLRVPEDTLMGKRKAHGS